MPITLTAQELTLKEELEPLVIAASRANRKADNHFHDRRGMMIITPVFALFGLPGIITGALGVNYHFRYRSALKKETAALKEIFEKILAFHNQNNPDNRLNLEEPADKIKLKNYANVLLKKLELLTSETNNLQKYFAELAPPYTSADSRRWHNTLLQNALNESSASQRPTDVQATYAQAFPEPPPFSQIGADVVIGRAHSPPPGYDASPPPGYDEGGLDNQQLQQEDSTGNHGRRPTATH